MMYFSNETGITVYFADGNFTFFPKDASNYEKIKEMCSKSNFEEVQILSEMNKSLINKEVSVLDEGIEINNVFFDKESIKDKVFDFIYLLKEKGVINSELKRIKPFLINLFQNPYIDAVEELYDYCKAMDFEITNDGHFFAYKRVKDDYSSYTVGSTGNPTYHYIDTYVEETNFDTDRNQTCSKGLHFCSSKYLDFWYSGQGKKLLLKVNPMDIVAIPTDHDHAKGRARKYYVLDEIEEVSFVTEKSKNEIVNNKSKRKKDLDNEYSRAKTVYDIYIDYVKQGYSTGLAKMETADDLSISILTVERHIRRYLNGK